MSEPTPQPRSQPEGPGPFASTEDRREFEGLASLERRMDTSGPVLDQLASCPGGSVLHAGIQGGSWLRPLSEWVSADGAVVVTEIDDEVPDPEGVAWSAAATAAVVEEHGLTNVRFVPPEGALRPNWYDLVISYRALYGVPVRFWDRIVDQALACVRPGGWFVIVEYDYRSWRYAPPAPSLERLNEVIQGHAQDRGAGDFTGSALPGLFQARGMTPRLHAGCVALPPGNLLLSKPISASGEGTGISDHVRDALGGEKVDRMRELARPEATDARRWTIAPTVLTAWSRRPGVPESIEVEG